ncbi:MAG: DNA polymerase III subunit delta [Paludibacteraceae bacterium]|nr:DNA polymerase III subunit delta [Paludibacteraceae bacterium]
MNYFDIVKQISIKQFMPIYVFMGDEPYYIDALTELLDASILTDDEKIMNETVLYGKDTTVAKVVTEARQYPIMSNYRLVFLKEAQTLASRENFSALEAYLQNPLTSTILVITYKGGTFDKRKAWIKQAEKLGIVFTSAKLNERDLPPVIDKMADKKGLSIDDDAVSLLVEYIGSDLTQLSNTISKFDILLPSNNRKITANAIEKVVGISKEFNVFALVDALFAKDARKANLIISHTKDDIFKIIPALYTSFSNLLIYQYMPTGLSNDAIAAKMGIRPTAVWIYGKASKLYSKMQTFKAIGYLRKYDTMSKGVNCASSADTAGLLKELVYKIMH